MLTRPSTRPPYISVSLCLRRAGTPPPPGRGVGREARLLRGCDCTTYILMTRPQAPGRPQTVLGREGARRRATDRSNY